MTIDILVEIFRWIYHIFVMLDDIYIPMAGCSVMEALCGMTLIALVLTLLTPWVYFDDGEGI